MVPTLYPGDVLLVWRGARIRPGDVVLARFADLGDTLVLKRAVRPADGPPGTSWIVAGDNAAAGGDSRTHGTAQVLGRAVLVRRGRRRVAFGLSSSDGKG